MVVRGRVSLQPVERLISLGAGERLHQPGESRQDKDQADDRGDELLPTDTDATAEPKLIGENRDDEQERADSDGTERDGAEDGRSGRCCPHGSTSTDPRISERPLASTGRGRIHVRVTWHGVWQNRSPAHIDRVLAYRKV